VAGSSGKEKRHPIQVVARRTGLTADVLRAWEKRYGILKPARSGGGRRLYSDDDIDYLRLLRRATGAGRNVGQLVDLSRDALQAIVREDDVAAAEVPVEPRQVLSADVVVDQAVDAIAALDGRRLDVVLRRAMIEHEAARFLDAVIVPVLVRIGVEWRHDRLTPAHEHLASRVIRQVLDEFTATFVPRVDAPRLLVATLQGQPHEFGAMLAAATAAAGGWWVTYIGADLPAAAIADAARQARVSVVGLSIVHPVDDPQIPAELRALRLALPPDIVLLVGGAGTVGYAKALRDVKAVLISDLASLRPALMSLAGASRNGD
jgi:DNA-binding transcriptional MerR regulator/methylmalonyl-CoA mutase cobalamin-binding subunit